nr:hypothetical protein [Tanacetum cinerariifolium]
MSSNQRVSTPLEYELTEEKENKKGNDYDMGDEQEQDEEDDLYRDVNINLERSDAEMTNAQANQDTEDTHVTLTTVPPVVQQQSSSVSLDLVSKFINPSSDTCIVDNYLASKMKEAVDVAVQLQTNKLREEAQAENQEFLNQIDSNMKKIIKEQAGAQVRNTPLLSQKTKAADYGQVKWIKDKFDQRVSALESKMSEFKQTNQFAKAISSIPGIVDNYLASKMKEAVDVAVQLQTNKLREEAQAENQEFLNQIDSNMKKIIKEQTSYVVVASLTEFKVKKILIDKIETNKSIDRKIEMIKTRMKTPSLDQTKVQREGDQAKKPSKSAQAEKHGQKVNDLKEHSHQEFNTRHDDVILVRETLEDASTQSSFNEFLATSIDFFAFIMNLLKIDNLTQEVLTDRTHDLIKGTCKSVVELECHLEEFFKATNDRLDWQNPKGKPYPYDLSKPIPLIQNDQGRQVLPWDYFINNDLEYLKGGSSTVQPQLKRTVLSECGFKNVHSTYCHSRTCGRSAIESQKLPEEDQPHKNRLMRTDELHKFKFSDAILNHVRTALNDIATEIEMDYLPKKK